MDDPGAGHDQQQRLDERRKALDLPVAVLVLVVRRQVGKTHGQVGHESGDEVERGVKRLGEDAQAAGRQPHDRLERGQEDRGQHRPERRARLAAVDGEVRQAPLGGGLARPRVGIRICHGVSAP